MQAQYQAFVDQNSCQQRGEPPSGVVVTAAEPGGTSNAGGDVASAGDTSNAGGATGLDIVD